MFTRMLRSISFRTLVLLTAVVFVLAIVVVVILILDRDNHKNQNQQALQTPTSTPIQGIQLLEPLSSTPTAVFPAGIATPTQAWPTECTWNATFVADITIPDGQQMEPGAEFVKTWRLRNSGACNWGDGFEFVFVKGAQMGAPDSVSVPPTKAGDTVDISVPFQAPIELGIHKSTWRMRDPVGNQFGNWPFVEIDVHY